MSKKEKIDIVRNVKYKYSSSWINKLESEKHWRLYWLQQKLMENSVKPGQNVLEIGVGSGFTANYLRSKGVNVTTFDIDEDKKPDIIGNLVSFDFSNLKFDHILAFEVFEHIPFEEFKKALEKLNLICDKNLFISLPKNINIWIDIEYKLPFIGYRRFSMVSKRGKISENHHFWEVGFDKFTKNYLRNTFNEKRFIIINEIDNVSHIFYKLAKI